MYRLAFTYLEEWRRRASRKPLVIRGARQIGKSFLVRALAKRQFDNVLEIDFEQMPDAASLFTSKQPREIISQLEARFDVSLAPGQSLLFLDEIQAAPDVLAALRYFHEKLPELHVVCAGSLLEFVLEEHSFSMPVGRIEYLHLGPMTFEEFLLAMGRDKLREWLCNYQIDDRVPDAIHNELLRLLRQYLVVGGMPEVVAAFAVDESYRECERLQQSILSTYRDDFSKYASKVQHRRVEKVFSGVPRLVGQKFMYSHIDREERSRDLSKALHMLCLARVCHQVRHTHANGVPLAAEADDRNFKVLFLDVGMLCRCLGLNIVDFNQSPEVLLVNSGAVAEQFVGQHLLYSGDFYEEPELHCWMRQKRNSNAEIDYIQASGPTVIPVEVKAGKTGTLKSLHFFVQNKGNSFAVRFNSHPPSFCNCQTALATGPPTHFRLLSLPLYMVGQAQRLCRDCMNR